MMLLLLLALCVKTVTCAARVRQAVGDLRMTRTRRGLVPRPAARLLRPAIAPIVGVLLLACPTGLAPGLGSADPGADTMGALIAEVARANQRLEELSAEVQTEQQSV